LHRVLGVSLKSAWFMAHRIREAMSDKGGSGPLGGPGRIVEADETYIGPPEYEFRNGAWHAKQGLGRGKIAVVSLVERGGRSRTIKVENLNTKEIRAFELNEADARSRLMTDGSFIYGRMHRHFAKHETVNHSAGEYVRGDVYTNTVESYFSVFKRGMRGIYQHCKARHLPRYLAEFDFRYAHRAALDIDDEQRTVAVIRGIVGKRLTYRAADRKNDLA
jgi:hypothetical protein